MSISHTISSGLWARKNKSANGFEGKGNCSVSEFVHNPQHQSLGGYHTIVQHITILIILINYIEYWSVIFHQTEYPHTSFSLKN